MVAENSDSILPKEAQEGIDNSLLVSFITNLILSIFFLLCFELFRTRFKEIYQPRCQKVDRSSLNPPPSEYFKWISVVIKAIINENEFFEKCGLDAIVCILFLKTLFYIMFIEFLFGVIILMPVNASGEQLEVYGTAILSMSKVIPGSPRLYFHLISVFFNSVVTCYFLYRAYKRFLYYQIKFKRLPLIVNYTVMLREIPEDSRAPDIILRYMGEMFPDQILNLELVPEVSRLDKLLKKKEDIENKLQRAELTFESTGTKPTTRESFWNICSPKFDAIDYYKFQLNSLEQKIISEQNKYHKYTGVAFLTLNSIETAVICSQVVFNDSPYHWKSEPSPEPQDIFWKHLGTSDHSRLIRRYIVYIIAFFLVFFWSGPVGFISVALFNLDRLSQVPALSFLVNLVELNPSLTAFIQGVLPSLGVVIFMHLLVPIISKLVEFEHPVSYSKSSQMTFTIYYFFLLINVFLVGTLLGTFYGLLHQLEAIFLQWTILPELLASYLPTQCNFFINYIMLQSMTGNILDLWRPVDFILFWVKMKFFAKTPKDKQALLDPPSFSYHVLFAQQLLYFTIIQAYSTLAPLILPFGLLAIVLTLLSTGYSLLYVCENPFEGRGRFFPILFSRTCVSLLIYQVTFIGVFTFNLFPPGSITILILILTVLFWFNLPKLYHGQITYGPLDQFQHLKILQQQDISLDYKRPSTIPIQSLAESKKEEVEQEDESKHTPSSRLLSEN